MLDTFIKCDAVFIPHHNDWIRYISASRLTTEAEALLSQARLQSITILNNEVKIVKMMAVT